MRRRCAEPTAGGPAGPASSARTAQCIAATTGADRSARYNARHEECPKRRHAERSAVETAGNAASAFGGPWHQRAFAVQRTGRDAGDTAARKSRRQSGRGAKIAPGAADFRGPRSERPQRVAHLHDLGIREFRVYRQAQHFARGLLGDGEVSEMIAQVGEDRLLM